MNVGFRIPERVDAEPSERSVDLRHYLHFLWRHWMLIVSATGLLLLMGVIYLAGATPLYTATTQVLLEQREKAPGLDTIVNDGGYGGFAYVENQLAILRSDSLLRRVAVKMLVPSTSEDSGAAGQGKGDEALRERAILDGIHRLRGALAVTQSGRAQVLNISITWDDAMRAAQLANAVADAYVVDQLDARLESAKRASGWLSDRLTELRRQLRDSEEAVATFREEHGLTRSGPTVALNDQQLTELNSKLIAARTDAAEKQGRVNFIADLAAGKQTLDSLPDSMLSGSNLIGPLRAKLADTSQREADLLARYSRNHPEVVNLGAAKRDIERSIAGEAQRMAQTVRSEFNLATARVDALERAMREATGQGELNNDAAVKLRELERTAAINKTLFEEFLQKARIADEQSTFRARDVRVIMPAQRGIRSFPKNGRVLLISLFIGLGIGIGGAFAVERLKSGFTSPRQVEEMLGIPVLASVRKLTKSQLLKDGNSVPLPLVPVHYPLSSYAEAIRTLRSSIHMSDIDQPPKVVSVTSSRPGEGKTTIALSLAISAASAGLKVALVDADLRHPSSSRFFRLEQEKGLVDMLISNASADSGLRLHKELKLAIIPAGSKTHNPPDVLASERMKEFVAHLKEKFDYVVLDTPPVGPVVDPVILANLVDATIFVVQWASTPRELIETSVKQVSIRKRVAGIVLNLVNQDRAKKYGGEYYYGKSYDKYYSE